MGNRKRLESTDCADEHGYLQQETKDEKPEAFVNHGASENTEKKEKNTDILHRRREGRRERFEIFGGRARRERTSAL
jgi:hypothetical protein